MTAKRSFFKSILFSVIMMFLAVFTFYDNVRLIVTGADRSVLKIVGTIGWVVIGTYFGRTLRDRLAERRQSRS